MKAPIDPFTGETLVQYFLRRDNMLETDRSSYLSHWQDLSRALMPRGVRFNSSEVGQGNKRNRDLINNTAGYAIGVAAAGMMTGITSPSRPWFQLRAADPALNKKHSVKVWLDEVKTSLTEIFLKSNLYTTLPLVYRDLLTFGVSAFAVLEDDEDIVRCYHFPIGSYKLAPGHRGDVEGVFRSFQMSTIQLVRKFGNAECSSTVQDAFRRKTFDKFYDVMHVVEKNPDHEPGKLESRYLPYRSCYFEKNNNEDQLLSYKGFHEMCVLTPRWTTVGEDVYGISPGMDALGDVQQLQKMEKRKLQLLDMLLQPPRSVPASLRDEYVGTLAGELTPVATATDGEAIKPNYVPNPYFNHLTVDIQNIEQRIKKLLNESLFLMIAEIDRGNVTATEIQARQQEKMMVLGPVLERLNDEMLDPLIKRVLGILERRGELPPPPPELQGAPISVEYISIMAQAMKLNGVVGVERLIGFVGSLAATRPDALDKLNTDEAVDLYSDMVGVPPSLINDEDMVKEIREQRAQEQQQQQAMAMLPQLANAAKTMADAQVSNPAMLAAMSGGATTGVM